ncbi:uncharacterized protein LOC131019808 [Salvia miltiorrhiza]|uniref:uncharacterized protein LOC131019808 n=1 Tax=Salvia miltiorrhiza TaxID=226208 RepID=UPI0025ACF51B|nr:uncharacterized protein LOC131019808 [Salvia miltiorrhiza]
MDIQTSPSFLTRGGVFRAGIDDGLGLKACELWPSLSRSPSRRICLIVAVNFEPWIYILDVGGGRCDGDRVEQRPNLRIPKSFSFTCFCVVDSILYAVNEDDVYSFRLSDKLSDVVLEDNMLEKLPILLNPKEDALPVQFGNCVLFFSTQIQFHETVDSPIRKLTCDFELYDPIHNVHTKLPQLWIRRPNTSRTCQTFQFLRPNSTWADFRISKIGIRSNSFTIESYAFNGTKFLVQTSFGRLFSIDLFDPSLAEWQLVDKDLKFTARGLNFITGDGRLCIDAVGVSRLEGDKHIFKSGVKFPLSCFPSVSRSVTLLDSCTPCIVRAATVDSSQYGEFWWVDVFEVDFSKLLSDGDKNEDGEKKEYMNHTVSFKLCIENPWTYSICVDSLFPF